MGIGSRGNDGVCLTLNIWHPNCWTTAITADTDAGLLGHSVNTTATGTASGHFTVYADTTDAVEGCIAEIRDSGLTNDVTAMQRPQNHSSAMAAPGNATRDVFVEYDSENSITDTVMSQGFIHNAPIHIHDGEERWPLFIADRSRENIHESLASLRRDENADVTIEKIMQSESAARSNVDLLSVRQREVLELACERGYYGWPRAVTLEDLADELDVAKPTVLEHLRKAEAKVLNAELESTR